jgi:hypothetical protein
VRADLLLLRTRNRDGAIGPYVEGVSVALSDFEVGGGVSALVPGLDTLAIVGSAGAYARTAGDFGWSTTLFLGLRGYNFHGAYAMANGLFVQSRLGLGANRQGDLLFGAQVDAEILALPFVLVWNAFR